MHKYELMFIVRPDVDEEALKASHEKVQALIADNDGQITSVDHIGKRRLAYLIDKHREGMYSVYTFQAPVQAVNELERVMNIDEQIIRHMVINLDEK